MYVSLGRLTRSNQTTGEAHDPDDRKGGSRVRSVRLFLKESHAAVGADMAGRGRA